MQNVQSGRTQETWELQKKQVFRHIEGMKISLDLHIFYFKELFIVTQSKGNGFVNDSEFNDMISPGSEFDCGLQAPHDSPPLP